MMMPVRTRRMNNIMETEHDDFIDIMNEQVNIYKQENFLNKQYGVPTHSMSAESNVAFLHDPPTPVSNTPSPPPTPLPNIPYPPPTPLSNTPSPPPSSQHSEAPYNEECESQHSETSHNSKSTDKTTCWSVFPIISFKIPSFFKNIFKFFSILMAVSFFHWLLVSIYMKWCYEPTALGIFSNLFMVSSPLCASINNLQQAMSTNFIICWLNGIVFCSTFVKKLVIF